MKNKIEDLRNHLFAALEGLQDDKNPMPIDRAKAIAEVAQVIVNSAKVEVDFIKATEPANASGFFPLDEDDDENGKRPKLFGKPLAPALRGPVRN